MQTAKEALLAMYRGETPDFVPAEGHCFKDLVFPGERYIDLEHFDPHGTGPDAWGVLWTNLGPDPAFDGNMVAANFKLFEHADEWKDHVHFPPLEHMPVPQVLNGMMMGMGTDREKDVVSVLLLSGQFERMNEMVGMEEALCAFYDCPDELHEFFDAMCEYKLKCIQMAYDAVHPDIIHMHDDWGTNTNMFFSPELWREFIKPNEKRYAEKIHSLGMLYEHHSCGFIEQIIPDLVEIGVDCINPLNICNDVAKIKREYGDKITLKGGVDNQRIDAEGVTEEEIRAEARRVMDAYAPGGRYIPSFIGTKRDVYNIFMDEVEKYGANFYRK